MRGELFSGVKFSLSEKGGLRRGFGPHGQPVMGELF